tara:strand:- start:390 stop:2444 length:2055 start_codon:yes stop_codon:yes gene_type:complete
MPTGNLGIGVSVYMRDMFSGPASRVNSSMSNLYRNAQRMQTGNLRAIQAQNAAIAGIGVMAIRGMGSAIKVGAQYGDMMTYIGAITDKTGISMESLSDKALNLGKNTMFTSRDIASGMRFMAQAGMSRSEVVGNIDAATSLAASTMSNLGGVGGSADIMTNIMRMFDKDQSQSGSVADILAVTTSSANLQLNHLGEAMKYAGTTMHGLKIPLSETAAMIGVMGDAGIQGSMAGTSLANMYRYLAKAMGQFGTKRQAKALDMLGLNSSDFMDSKGDLIERGEILRKVLTAAQNQTTIGGKTMMDALFGIRGEKAATLLINNLDKYQILMNKIKNGKGTSGRITEERMNSLQGNMLKVSSAFEVFQTRFTQSLKPILIPLLKVVTKVINGFTALLEIPLLGKFFGGFIAGFVIVKTAAALFKVVISSIGLIYNRNAAMFAANTAAQVRGYATRTAAARGHAAASGMYGQTGRFGSSRGAYFNRGGAMVASGTGRRRRGTALSMSPAGLGTRYMRRFGGMRGSALAGQGSRKGIMGLMGRMGGRLAAGGAAGAARGLGARALGVLGGPIGMILSIGIPLVSSLMGAIHDNTDELKAESNRKNNQTNRAVDLLTRYVIRGKGTLSGMGYAGDISTISNQRLADKVSSMSQFGSTTSDGRPITNIYIDGMQAKMQEEAENVLRTNLQGY